MSTLRALVIDDSRVMRNMVMKSLTETGLAEFEFTEAGNGQEGVDKFDADTCDIIFADWNMPGMNGIEFARQIRAMPWAKHIPVVMVTSESGDAKMQDAFDKARITCYITKPFTVEEMTAKIRPVIDEVQKRRDDSAAAAESAPAPAAVPAAPAAKPSGGGFFSKLLK